MKANKYIISFDEADRLIERYYEGETSVADEKLLQQFLMSDKLPEKYSAEKAMFGYFRTENVVAKRRFTMPVYARWAATVALLITFGFSALLYTEKTPDSYAMVNGQMVTDNATLKELMNSSIADISENNTEIEDNLNAINNTNLINEQLEVFSGIE